MRPPIYFSIYLVLFLVLSTVRFLSSQKCCHQTLSTPQKVQVAYTRVMEARLSFLNGAETVTGAHFLLSASSQKETLQVLIDCGLLQGVRFSEDENRKPFPYDPKTMPYLIVTHAHLDHIGRIPKLVHDGFRGVIYSTPATKEIARLMFADAVGLLSLEASKHDRPPLYDHEDVEETLLLWKTVAYHKREKL